jgi:DNA-directed RNA polymerase specialized sigma24 family protein
MRLQLRKQDQPRTGARRDLREERFKAYFPRMFAFACSATGDDEAARDACVTAFASVFALPDMREAEFEVELFRSARELCSNGEYRVRRYNDGLTPREREVISLVFDAQLELEKVGELLDMRPDVVSIALTRGLRKLRSKLAPEGVAGAVLPTFS